MERGKGPPLKIVHFVPIEEMCERSVMSRTFTRLELKNEVVHHNRGHFTLSIALFHPFKKYPYHYPDPGFASQTPNS